MFKLVWVTFNGIEFIFYFATKQSGNIAIAIRSIWHHCRPSVRYKAPIGGPNSKVVIYLDKHSKLLQSDKMPSS